MTKFIRSIFEIPQTYLRGYSKVPPWFVNTLIDEIFWYLPIWDKMITRSKIFNIVISIKNILKTCFFLLSLKKIIKFSKLYSKIFLVKLFALAHNS